MSRIFYVINLTIADGKLDEFKKLAAGFFETTEKSEPDTLGYQWYLSEGGGRCLIKESFANSEALLEHLQNVGPSLPPLLEIAPIDRFEVFGTASDAARAALAGLGAVHFPFFAGFER